MSILHAKINKIKADELEKVIKNEECGCSRREFLEKTIKGAGGFFIAASSLTLLAGCSDNNSSPVGPGGGGGSPVTVDLSQSQFASLGSAGGSAALGSNSLDASGILIYREPESVFKAYSRRCTHSGCTINPFSGGISRCDCHGSQFNTSGSVVTGPANRALGQYTVKREGNILTIS